MLRRKLLVVLGSVVVLLLGSGLAAIVLLQDVLQDLDRSLTQASSASLASSELHVALARLPSLQQGANGAAGSMSPDLQLLLVQMQLHLDALGRLDAAAAANQNGVESYGRLNAAFTQLMHEMRSPVVGVMATLVSVQNALTDFDTIVHSHTEQQQQRATMKFRWTAVVLGLAFVLVINASIMVFSRMSSMILKPVDRLVEASRKLAREEFDYRVELARRDEFGELANAYNHLAEQLQANERRKVETLHQVARTLSHELNNAISIIQSQLDLMARAAPVPPEPPGARRAAHDPTANISLHQQFRGRLREIQQALARMHTTVSDLTRVRRIVLTDYLSGMKMLDLQRSVEDDTVPEPLPAAKNDGR